MGVITTGNHPKALWPGIAKWFGRKYDEWSPEYSQIFEQVSSEKTYEERVELTGFGLAPQKNQNASVSYDSETQGYISRLTNITFGLGYIVSREEMEDNLYEEVSMRRSAALAFSMRQTKENVGANIINRAFNSSYAGGDGQELISTDHPTADGGTQSNYIATAADLSETVLEDLITQISKATNSRGLRIQLMPDCLIVPSDLWWESNRILKSTLQNDSANNAINVLKSTSALPGGIKMNHYLTDTDAWFIKTKVPSETGLIHQERRAMDFTQDNDFDTENAKAKSTERYVFGWVDWRGCFGSPGA